MQRLIASYETGDEFEVRYYIDPRARHPAECLPAKHPGGFRPTLDRIISRLGGTAAACHRRIIDLHLGELRKRIVYDAAERREEWCEKRRKADWVEPNDFGGLRVALACETPVEPRRLTTVDRIALKYRLTFALDCLGLPSPLTEAQRGGAQVDAPWLVEVSAVKISDLHNIQDDKAKLLACRDPFELATWWDHWEFERELNDTADMPAASTLSLLELDDLYQSYTLFAPLVDHEMLDTVRRAAIMIAHPKAQSFQRLSPRNTITRLLPKAVEPTLENWIENYAHRLEGMVLRDKIDGTRELVWVRGGKLVCVGAKTMDEWDEDEAKDTYIFDCEFLADVWYVLHPLVWRGRCVTDLCDSERIALATDAETGVERLGIAGLRVCPVVRVGSDTTAIAAWWTRAAPTHRDGLIISTDEAYFTQASLKWKPAEESTVDMLIVRCPDWLLGKAPYVRAEDGDDLYILNVGTSAAALMKTAFPIKRYLDIFAMDKTTVYVPQPFTPPDHLHAHVWSTSYFTLQNRGIKEKDLHGHIGEFQYECATQGVALGGRWQLRRLRDDKPSLLRGGTEIGNDVRTAMDIWSKITNPFPLEYIWQPPVQRASRFDVLLAPVQRIIADLIEEESVTSALVHMCPWIPFDSTRCRGVLMPARATDALAEYRPDLSNNSRIVQVLYDQIGRIELPKDFIGGAQMLVSMDPELLGHVSCLGKVVASGGRMVVVVRTEAGDDAHPEVGRAALLKDMDRVGFALMHDHGEPELDLWNTDESDWSRFRILSFRKENRGASDMRPDEVRKENPHIADNPDANFIYKFSRQKTKDIAGLIGRAEDCGSLEINPERGELLVDIEFLSTLTPTSQVLYVANDTVDEAKRVDHLRRLFPTMQFRTTREATAGTVEAAITHCSYTVAMELIKQYEPHCGLLDFSHHDLASRVLKGRIMLHPYATLDSTRVSLVYGRERQEWNIMPDIFKQEMMTFHRVYRPTAFKYATKCKSVATDNCYDCRTSIYILTKYAKLQKITLDEAYARLG